MIFSNTEKELHGSKMVLCLRDSLKWNHNRNKFMLRYFRNQYLINTFWFLSSFTWGLLFISVCSDWVGFWVDEGFTNYGARRVLEGEVPYKDFFFLWSPGVLYLHAAVQKFISINLVAGRICQLIFCSISVICIYRVVSKIFLLENRYAHFAAGLAVLWGFSLWNMPYSSWYAISFALVAAIFAFERNFFICGIFFALSFWMKQNVGIFSPILLCAVFLLEKNYRAVLRLALGFLVGIIPGLFYFYFHNALGSFLSQVFLFPFTYAQVMGKFFDSSDLSYSKIFFYIMALLGSVLLWIKLVFTKKNTERQYCAIAIGCLMQVYPRFDFQHILFSFPVLLPCLVEFFSRQLRSNSFFKIFFLLIFTAAFIGAGIVENAFLLKKRIYPAVKLFSIYCGEAEASIFLEAQKVIAYIKQRDLDQLPVLVYPHFETLYYLAGWKNSTPHNQFLPSYVESFGAKQSSVISEFERSKGGAIVYIRNTGLEKYTQTIADQIFFNYRESAPYPIQFSVYEKKSMIKVRP